MMPVFLQKWIEYLNFVTVLSMKFPSYIIIFGWRLLSREWSKYSLAFLSLFITSVTFTVVLTSVDGAQTYLGERSREFAGGDLILEAGSPIDITAFIAPIQSSIVETDRETSLQLAVRSNDQVTGVSARAISSGYPLYGTLELVSGEYQYPKADEVYAERKVLERLSLNEGDELFIGNVTYSIRGTILREPDALVQGFRFAPRLILSEEGLARAEVALSESRSEYEYRFRLAENTSRETLLAITKEARDAGMEARIVGEGESGFLRRLAIVEKFFLITILIGAVLSAVNVYANTLSLVVRLRRSFAILLVEGATQRGVVILVSGLIGMITLMAALLGMGVGFWIVSVLYNFIEKEALITLPFEVQGFTVGLVLLGTLATSLAAGFPAVRDLLSLNPRTLLSGATSDEQSQGSAWRIIFLSLISFAPLLLLAWALLGRINWASMVIGGTFGVFIIISFVFSRGLRFLYAKRHRMGFFTRTIIAQKYADGIFGIIAATSLFIALTSIFTLSLLKSSIEDFFDAGIGNTVPSAYVIDVQSDQVELVEQTVPSITLFPNIRARIIQIDDRKIQEKLVAGDSKEDQELRREFNLTYRTDLLSSETITSGVWQGERSGEVSVERDFAERVGIRVGSRVEFSIQGVRLTFPVTSLRSADTTSGLPFFYFVLHPSDAKRFPASSFGYADVSSEELRGIERKLAADAPNISVLDTTSIGESVRQVTSIVLTLLAVVTVPPLLLATLLLVTLVATTFFGRRRDAVRLQILGATRRTTSILYVVETLMTVVVMGIGAMLFSMLLVFLITKQVLVGISPVYVDKNIVWIIFVLVVTLVLYALSLLIIRKKPLREEMTYEENI
jgi:putative ABC transport system permease protein